jgi:hypothetical protein
LNGIFWVLRTGAPWRALPKEFGPCNDGDLEHSREALEEALIELGFSADREFGIFVTYGRQRYLVKVHVAPDGMFAAFGGDDEILGEGTGAEDLRCVLMEAALTSARDTPHRRSFLDRRTKQKPLEGRRSGRLQT